MSNVEPEAQDFLKKIAWSVFYGIAWMMINMTFGIYLRLFFIEGKIRITNILFYIFFLITLIALVRFYYRTWKQKFPHG
jgi:hypothetical protein